MREKNLKKFFNIFYFRFIIIIVSLNISKREKYKYFKRIIFNKLKYKILNYNSFISY